MRQAVCNALRAVIGYEVLTGDPDAPPASARFCARALLEAFTDVDLDLVAPHHPAYLTVAPALLLRLDMLPVSPDRVVLQVETAATVHEEVVAAVSRLAGYGYAFAAVRREPDLAGDSLDVDQRHRSKAAGIEGGGAVVAEDEDLTVGHHEARDPRRRRCRRRRRGGARKSVSGTLGNRPQHPIVTAIASLASQAKSG